MRTWTVGFAFVVIIECRTATIVDALALLTSDGASVIIFHGALPPNSPVPSFCSFSDDFLRIEKFQVLSADEAMSSASKQDIASGRSGKLSAGLGRRECAIDTKIRCQ